MNSEQWLLNHPIAHRGLWSDVVPENSSLAFERACEKGYPIECDVRMCADGRLVIFHDRNTKRMTGTDNEIEHMSYDHNTALSLRDTDQKILSLEEALVLVNGRVPLLIEMKNDIHTRSLYIEKIKKVLSQYTGTYALSSFDPFLVKRAKKSFPHIVCGQNFSDHRNKGPIKGWMYKMGAYILWACSRFQPDFYVCRASMIPKTWIRRVAKNRNGPLLTWAIANEKEYHEIRSHIDNYIFDDRPFT
jgi:glycerophosphoryl diester phosphodiesterase